MGSRSQKSLLMFDLSFTQQQNVILCKIDIVNRLFKNVIGYESKNPL